MKSNIAIQNLFNHTPKWASIALSVLSFLYIGNGACQQYDLYKLPENLQHKVDGLYGVGNLLLLSFGAKKEQQKIVSREEDNQ